MAMKYDENGDVIFESTGRRVSPTAVTGVFSTLTMDEKREVALYMIEQWLRWAAIPSDG
jgi:hypothetical protein